MRLPRTRRLTEGSDFRAVRESGNSKVGRFLVLGFLEDASLAGFRFGFVTSRRVGNAVVRNRVRRRLRAIVREHGEQLRSNTGGRVVTVARYTASSASYAELAKDWCQLARRLGVLESRNPGEER